ncbi:hypothetical protein HMPREF9088_1906 [Enterococcus italicus DSM 15952]|uniref:Uncharacterized protein n=1 Tax=Enterococcus italicus (strain DSM 15952 / CCUG 50447 / LMG 22039 / TP 1.5) TaxID=888064 RepID=E6LHR6_ENTI1|nr:hypothetical protein HMPREF9088_1906 [Enterococcus italicus DSM 15952]OJG59442.1 family 16 glycoside hydrolase [Enterococcus italicus DSM 15952]
MIHLKYKRFYSLEQIQKTTHCWGNEWLGDKMKKIWVVYWYD